MLAAANVNPSLCPTLLPSSSVIAISFFLLRANTHVDAIKKLCVIHLTEAYCCGNADGAHSFIDSEASYSGLSWCSSSPSGHYKTKTSILLTSSPISVSIVPPALLHPSFSFAWIKHNVIISAYWRFHWVVFPFSCFRRQAVRHPVFVAICLMRVVQAFRHVLCDANTAFSFLFHA